MKSLPALFGAVALVVLLTSCEAPANIPGPGAQQHSGLRDSWIARRESQLKQMGLNDSQAAMKAAEEWQNLGNSAESYTLYDSRAKQKAQQDKFEDDFAKSKKGN